MITRPAGMGALQFVVLANLRTVQLIRGCVPRVSGHHRATVVAQMEVAAGHVMAVVDAAAATSLAENVTVVDPVRS